MDFDADSARLTGSLHALSLKTDAAERRILESAMSRETVVRDRMDALRPSAMTSAAASREYQTLALERRRLSLVIAMARKNLA